MEFLGKLQISQVAAEYKIKDDTDIENYRPISVLPAISKVFEKTMFNRLIERLEEYNALGREHPAFRKNNSLVKLFNLAIESIDNKTL